MSIIKNVAIRFFISILVAGLISKQFPQFEFILLITITIAMFLLLSKMANKFLIQLLVFTL